MGPTIYAPEEAVGAPDHPHRGFETITYILEGAMLHEDSEGSRSALEKGDAQWMTAGKGLVHSELPSSSLMKHGGLMHAIQIWVNLPKAKKMVEPKYQDIRENEIPLIAPSEGVDVRLLSGKLFGVTGPAKNQYPIFFAFVTVAPESRWKTSELSKDHTVLAYVIDGEGIVGETRSIERGNLVEFEKTAGEILFENHSSEEKLRFLLLGGTPIREPTARMGPFVMNTKQELEIAYDDYLAGRLGAIKRK